MKNFNFHILTSKYLPISLVKYIIDMGALSVSYLLTKYILHISIIEYFYYDIIFLLIASTIASYTCGLYHHLWRFTSLYNIFNVFKYCLGVTFLFAGWNEFKGEETETLLKFCFLFLMFSFASLNSTRIFVRVLFEQLRRTSPKEGINVIVIGAGKGAELFIRETKKSARGEYQIEAILDDDPNLWGRKLFGIKIYGPIKDIGKLASSTELQMVIIAIPSLTKEKLVDITTTTKELGLQVRVLPSFDSLLIKKNTSAEDISIEDLLGRDSINLDAKEASKFIQNKIVLITGAGGSIGSEICHQVIRLNPKAIIIVDHSEYNLYKISWEIEHVLKYLQFVPILANVSDLKTMETIFKTHNPDVVFHSAAYKHVPLLERQAKQAIENNFFGTKNVAELASKYGSEKFILVSTDKAVNPTNIMGSTKRMAEIFCQNFNETSKTSYITVRFGNVLGSAGSVIPLFKKQLKQGGPLTVTHPEITRFFMSIPEASQLVLQAGAMGIGGEIFVLDMGDPVKILDLAERLISLSGKRPHKDIDIVFSGLRPGEKLYEELFYENESHTSTKRKKIFLANSTSLHFHSFIENTHILEESLNLLEEDQLVEIISKMVPEAKISLFPRSIYGVDNKINGIADA